MNRKPKVDIYMLKEGTHTIELRSGEWIHNPTTTSGRKIVGPATVKVSVYKDGGIDVYAEFKGGK